MPEYCLGTNPSQALAKLQPIIDRGKYGGRTQCANTSDFHQPACHVLSIGDRFALLCHFADPFFEAAEIG